MGIYVIHEYTQDSLTKHILKDFRLEIPQSIELLKNLSLDADIEVEKNKISLICPLTKDLIQYPIRGKRCKHFSCLCLKTLINVHHQFRIWGCPLCNERINEPMVDIWVMTALRDNAGNNDEAIFYLDGRF